MKTDEIRRKIRAWGASLVGFSDVAEFVLPEAKPLRYAVSVAVSMNANVTDEISSGPTFAYAAQTRRLNAVLADIARQTSELMRSLGAATFPVAVSQTIDHGNQKAFFPHKTAATRAGLGWVGRNALLVTPEYGPRVRLTTVLTDYPFKPAVPFFQGHCGDCQRCRDVCPVKAIRGASWKVGIEREALLDVSVCQARIEANRRIFNAPVCGQCLSVCPVGRAG